MSLRMACMATVPGGRIGDHAAQGPFSKYILLWLHTLVAEVVRLRDSTPWKSHDFRYMSTFVAEVVRLRDSTQLGAGCRATHRQGLPSEHEAALVHRRHLPR